MLTFTLSALAGALIGGSYVLIRTPRSGKENQQFVKDFVQTTQENIQNVSEQALGVEQALQNLTVEVQNVQEAFLPEVLEITEKFAAEAAVSKRRINDEIDEINRELNNVNIPIVEAQDTEA